VDVKNAALKPAAIPLFNLFFASLGATVTNGPGTRLLSTPVTLTPEKIQDLLAAFSRS
jgi:hypothetical protein